MESEHSTALAESWDAMAIVVLIVVLCGGAHAALLEQGGRADEVAGRRHAVRLTREVEVIEGNRCGRIFTARQREEGQRRTAHGARRQKSTPKIALQWLVQTGYERDPRSAFFLFWFLPPSLPIVLSPTLFSRMHGLENKDTGHGSPRPPWA